MAPGDESPSPEVEAPDAGFLFSGGSLVASSDEAFYRRVSAVVSSFVQVKNLSILIGAGASYPLGSPRIRSMQLDAIHAMLERGACQPSTAAHELLKHIVDASGGEVDLERFLTQLAAAMAITRSGEAIDIAGQPTTVAAVQELRGLVNRSLALDCDLPTPGGAFGDDPLAFHRMFFRRLLRARRSDLPRVRLFTTNYDLIIEKSLDQEGIVYFDGFTGTVERVFRPESLERDLYLPPEPDQRRLLRVPDLIYLYKLHGSINWRIASSMRGGLGGDGVVQTGAPRELGADELAIIFPTPLKEGDVLAYPYSALFRAFMAALSEPDSALLTIGYGFADDHINRQILQALGSPTFQLFAVAPDGVVDSTTVDKHGRVEVNHASGPLAAIAQVADARIKVLTGREAGRFDDMALNAMPDTGETIDRTPIATQVALAGELLDS